MSHAGRCLTSDGGRRQPLTRGDNFTMRLMGAAAGRNQGVDTIQAKEHPWADADDGRLVLARTRYGWVGPSKGQQRGGPVVPDEKEHKQGPEGLHWLGPRVENRQGAMPGGAPSRGRLRPGEQGVGRLATWEQRSRGTAPLSAKGMKWGCGLMRLGRPCKRAGPRRGCTVRVKPLGSRTGAQPTDWELRIGHSC